MGLPDGPSEPDGAVPRLARRPARDGAGAVPGPGPLRERAGRARRGSRPRRASASKASARTASRGDWPTRIASGSTFPRRRTPSRPRRRSRCGRRTGEGSPLCGGRGCSPLRADCGPSTPSSPPRQNETAPVSRGRVNRRRIRDQFDRAVQDEAEGFRQEDRHLAAGVRVVRAEVAPAATAGDAAMGQVLDPGVELAGAGHVRENRSGTRRRDVGRSQRGLEQEHGHLGAGDRIGRAEVSSAAASGEATVGEVLDPGVEDSPGTGHVREDGPGAGGRRVGGAELGLEKEDRHLRARHGIARTVAAARAAPGNAVVEDRFDVGVELVPRSHVVEALAHVEGPDLGGQPGRLDGAKLRAPAARSVRRQNVEPDAFP